MEAADTQKTWPYEFIGLGPWTRTTHEFKWFWGLGYFCFLLEIHQPIELRPWNINLQVRIFNFMVSMLKYVPYLATNMNLIGFNLMLNLGIHMTTNVRPMAPNVLRFFSNVPLLAGIEKIQNFRAPPNFSNVPFSGFGIFGIFVAICYLLSAVHCLPFVIC